jgi:superfamily I DNA/RNA helicase
MRLLPKVRATAEQLPILHDTRPGVILIRGAAGSGKTTTALMRLRQLCAYWQQRKVRSGDTDPVRVLVLTFNKTLEGYIEALAEQQVAESDSLRLEISTFAKFAWDVVGGGINVQGDTAQAVLKGLCRTYGGNLDFVVEEVEYLLSRFEPKNLEEYMAVRRDGRGLSPRMETAAKRRLLDEVVYPYIEMKRKLGIADWNDLALAAAGVTGKLWDVVVVDETQDFSANEIRAVMKHVAVDNSVTFVMDSAQQIYARWFTWKEVGIVLASSHMLRSNHRNTREIAEFALPLVQDLSIGDNGALPDFSATTETGPKPVVLVGKHGDQVRYAIKNIVNQANLAEESVAFLQPWGGGWFREIRKQLTGNSIPWVSLQSQSEWPGGAETVAICTLHSAKGLEFDHVFILGLTDEVTPHGEEADDSQLDSLRRLVAMGIGRARKTVTLGYKPEDASTLIHYLDPATFTEIAV